MERGVPQQGHRVSEHCRRPLLPGSGFDRDLCDFVRQRLPSSQFDPRRFLPDPDQYRRGSRQASLGDGDRLLKGSRRFILQFITGVVLTVTLVLGLTPRLPPAPLFILFFLLGFSAFGWNGVFLVLGGELAGRGQAGRATGFIMTVVFLGNVVGPLLFGRIIDATGGYRLAWIFVAATMSVSLCCLQKIQERNKSEGHMGVYPSP